MRTPLLVISLAFCFLHGFSQYDVIVELKNKSGNPVEGKVTIDDYHFITETISGTAYFRNVPRGRITISVFADGYEPESSRNYNVTSNASDNIFTIKLIPLEKNQLIITGYVNLPDSMNVKYARVVFSEFKTSIALSDVINEYGFYRLDTVKDGMGDNANLSLFYKGKMISEKKVLIPFENDLIYWDFDIKPASAQVLKVKFYYNYPDEFPLKSEPIIRCIYDVEYINGGFIIQIPEHTTSDSVSFSIGGNGIMREDHKFSITGYSDSNDPFPIDLKREIREKHPWAQISPFFYQFSYITNFSNNDENEIDGKIQHTVGFFYHPTILKQKLALGLSYTFKTQLSNINSYSTLNGHSGNIETNYDVTNYPALRIKGILKPFNYNEITLFFEIVLSVSHFESGSKIIPEEEEDLEPLSSYSFYTFIPIINIGLRYNVWFLSLELSSGFSTYELNTRDYAFDYWGYGYTNYVQSKTRFYDIPLNLTIIGNIPSKH